ncbi:FAD-dependent oxidoreductase [Mycolicibacterium septicum]|uniref:FAD-dependent oxidoreductase n=1 Tax=Mycolicibacterium septicum TaxID=98668 RepID=UPI0023E32E14|nr:FAD-dependent oxidoreductase [Mycolicibacterium septicum]MDF3337493.1 FAD-dependent oxidoreductase [Mycolicibacterium septicum]
MSYVITQNCCKDASCVPVCPVDCIRPVHPRGRSTSTEMLFIDPDTCIDCGACMEACPVDAIYYDEDLPAELEIFRDINARYFAQHPLEPGAPQRPSDHSGVDPGTLRVAIVGAGPAACYAAAALMRTDGVEVDVYDRLPTPYGLIRAGVAPDHQHTKSVVDIFGRLFSDKRVACHFNVHVGRDLTHDDLTSHHHAVIYAVGAAQSRQLEIPGEDLPGSYPAADFVGWYNGHPDHAARTFDLSGDRAVIVGNGNVALDVARVLLLPAENLATTDIAQHALDALSGSSIREIVILGRRGPRHGAYSVGEFAALEHLPGIDIVVDADETGPSPEDGLETALKLELARRYAHRATTPGNKRIVFRYNVSPSEIVGTDRADGVIINAAGGPSETLTTPLILRSIGYRGSPVPTLPFDEAAGVMPNEGGRVLDDVGDPVSGVYVTGWIKRGPRGVIGTNRACAEETVERLWQDFDRGLLSRPVADRQAVEQLLTARGAAPIGWQEWRAIDSEERRRGSTAKRPRVKFVEIAEMLAAARK